MRVATVSAALLLGAGGCIGMADENSGSGADEARASASLGPAANVLWDKHVRAVPTAELQPACVPFHLPPRAGVPRQGTVVMLHGFSACPQQFREVGAKLANDGYDVLVPLLPGQGRKQLANGDDDLSKLPKLGEEDAYESFVADLNEVAAATPGKHAILGLSFGGTLAARAVQRMPDLYGNALLVAPFYRGSSELANAFARVASELEEQDGDWTRITDAVWNRIGGRFYSRGAVCDQERALGRAGVCGWNLTHAAAMLRFGRATLPGDLGHGNVQIIGTAIDRAIDNDALATAAADARSSCLYPAPVTHSMYSRFDDPHVQKTWLPSLEASTVAFLTRGTAFASTSRAPRQALPTCKL